MTFQNIFYVTLLSKIALKPFAPAQALLSETLPILWETRPDIPDAETFHPTIKLPLGLPLCVSRALLPAAPYSCQDKEKHIQILCPHSPDRNFLRSRAHC